MKEKIIKIHNSRCLFLENNIIWIARGLTFYAIDIDGKRVSRKYRVGNFFVRFLSKFRIIRQGLRLGIHHLIILKNGNFLITIKKKTLTIDKNTGKVLSIFEGYKGNKPGHQGICVTNTGKVLFCEYTLNTNREHSSNVYLSTDNGITFKQIYKFHSKEIRHIHFIKHDDREDAYYLGTGDTNDESMILKSKDDGYSWQKIGYGSQDWRAIGVVLTDSFILWGTDAGHVDDLNKVFRLDKKTSKLDFIDFLDGPCHGCAKFANGDIYISSGVEGGTNEKDRKAKLFKVCDNKLIKQFESSKDVLPYIIQYGVIRFPLNTETCDFLIFTTMGLVCGGECVFICRGLNDEKK